MPGTPEVKEKGALRAMRGTIFSYTENRMTAVFRYRQHLLVLAYVLLASALSIHRGSYSDTGFALALLAFGAATAAVWRSSKRMEQITAADLLGTLVVTGMLGMAEHPVTYPGTEGFARMVHGFLPVAAAVIVVAYASNGLPQALRRSAAMGVAGVAVLLRLALPVFAPDPLIDVFTVQQESAQHLLEGKNPFSTPTSDPYVGKGIVLPYVVGTRFAYPPASLLGSTAGYVLFGDVRVLYALCDLVLAWVLWRIARKAGKAAELLPLLWLLHPQGYLFIGQSWTEPLIIAGFALTALAHHEKKPWLAAIGHGLTVGLKQYLVIVTPVILLLERRWKMLAVSAAALLLPALPFMLWDTEALVLGQFAVLQALRLDSLSLSVAIYHTGIRLPLWFTLSVGFGTMLAMSLALKRARPLHAYLAAACLPLFAMFLFGTQGFANYYALVSGLMLLLVADLLAHGTTDAR